MNRMGLDLLVHYVGDTCISGLTVIDATIKELESKELLITTYCLSLIICCLQTYNVASEEIVGDTYVPSLIVTNTTINKVESKVSLITTHCLRLFVIVYKHVMLQHQRKQWVKGVYQVLLSSTVQLTS